MSLEKFEWLLNDFSDEVPDSIISGEGNLKVRRNWWQALVANLSNGITNHVIPENLDEEVIQFLEKYTSKDFKSQRLTTSDDITAANNLLKKILKLDQHLI